MSVALLDVNLLMALAWSDHVHHAAARRWFLAEAAGGWSTCPFVECGFLRLSSNPRITPLAGNAADALTVLKGLLAVPGHRFWPEDFSPTDHPVFAGLQGHNQVTDTYLVLLAHRRNGRLATFDGALSAFAGEALHDERCVLVVPS